MDLDFYDLSEYYSDEEKIARDSIAAYLHDKVKPLVKEAWHKEKPLNFQMIARDFGNLGMIGAFLPDDFNCPGSDYKMFGIICEEVERIDSALRSFIAVSSGLVMYPIYAYGSTEQKHIIYQSLQKEK